MNHENGQWAQKSKKCLHICPWGLVTASPIFRYRAARVAKNYTVLLALKAILWDFPPRKGYEEKEKANQVFKWTSGIWRPVVQKLEKQTEKTKRKKMRKERWTNFLLSERNGQTKDELCPTSLKSHPTTKQPQSLLLQTKLHNSASYLCNNACLKIHFPNSRVIISVYFFLV